MPFRAAVLATCAALLGGCQATYHTLYNAVGVAVPLTAEQAHEYDGSYQGYIRTTAAKNASCPDEPGERVLMVGDGVLWYAYTPGILFASPVRYDGSIDNADGETHITGKITGNTLRATVSSPICTTQLKMRYIGNHGP